MKVLVTNNTLGGLGGSETYAYTLIKELHSRKDITVHAFSKSLGVIANKLNQEGIKVISTVGDDYDLILSSHNSTTPFILKNKGLKIQTCHGVYPALEQPANGLDRYISISEEVQKHLTVKGKESEIIFNGVDCNRFKPVNPLNDEVKSILSLSHSEELNNTLKVICSKLGITLTCLNKYRNPVFHVEEMMNRADMVITLGRGAYEAMACGRNVMILDKRPYIKKPPLGDGLIDGDNVNDFMKNNCSGRFSNRIFNAEDIEKEILRYDPKYGEFSREFAINNLNIIEQANKYLKLL